MATLENPVIEIRDIDTLLFDLGGVIIDLSIDRSKNAFRRLGLENPDKLLNAYVQSGPFAALESGSIPPDEFYDKIREMLPENKRKEATDTRIREAFSDFLLGLPKERLRALHRLSGKYRVCLLSNTNPIMWNGEIERLFREDGHDREYYFPGGIVTSFEAKSMKPSPDIFEYAVKKLSLVPGRTLFLDDGSANIEEARKLGFKALLVSPDTNFINLLEEYGLF